MFHRGHRGPPARTRTDVVLGELRLGVVSFFVLSGFLLARPWVAAALDGTPPPRLRRYLRRRAARVLPAYWLALAGVYVLLSTIGHPNRPQPGQFPVFALFLQNQFAATANKLDPPMWTLTIEVTFYALVPLLGWWAVRAGRPRRRESLAAGAAALAAVGVASSWIAQADRWPETATAALPVYLPLFACGVLAAVATHGRALGRVPAVALVLAGAALVVLDGCWHVGALGGLGGRTVLRDLPAAAGFALVVAALVGAPSVAGPLATRPAVTLGTISYGIYLWHFPLIQWLRGERLMPDGLWTAALLVLTLSAAAGAASWWLVERPALRRLAVRPA